MPSNITLKNVPDELHRRLRVAAAAHHRSVNSEAIVCLEQALLPIREPVEDTLRRIQALRSTVTMRLGDNDEVNDLKNAGRR